MDLYSVGQPVEAAVLLWFAAGTWLFLAAVLALRVLYEPGRFAREARSPSALTGVAGTGVLGTAFAVHGYYPVAAVMLGLAGVSWALLLAPVLSHWETPAAGVSFLLTVATEGLAVLGATLAARNGAVWLLIAASAALILGLAFYIVTVTRFAVGQLLILLLALLPAALAFVGVYFLFKFMFGPVLPVFFAALAGSVILAVEAGLGVLLLGKLFERFDVTEEPAS